MPFICDLVSQLYANIAKKDKVSQGYAFLMGTEKCTLLFFYKMK